MSAAAVVVFAGLLTAGCTGPTAGNLAPVASFQLAHGVFQLSEVILFDGNASSDPEGNPLVYQWNFGDGGTASGPIAVYAYALPGPFTVTLTVTDSQGASNTHAADLTINSPPHALLEVSPGPYFAKQLVSFAATGSADPDGRIEQYLWQFGDGTSSNEAAAAHAYDLEGTYTVHLKITDNYGASDSASTTLFADLHTYDVGFSERGQAPDSQRNFTVANATKQVTLEIFQPNITLVLVKLEWRDPFPVQGPPNDLIRLTVTTPDGPSQTMLGDFDNITLEFNLNAIPSPVQVRAATPGDVPGVLGDAYVGPKGIGVWVIEITAVSLQGGLAQDGGFVPEPLFFWTLTTTITTYEANPVQTD